MVPCQRKSRSQSKMGRSHKKLSKAQLVSDPYSGTPKRSHRACPETGYVAPKGNRPGFFLFKREAAEA